MIYLDLDTPLSILLSIDDKEFRESAEAYRIRILSNKGHNRHSIIEANHNKRKIIRKRNLAIRKDRMIQAKSQKLVPIEPRDSDILDHFNPDRYKKWKKQGRNKEAYFDLKGFSFFDNPDYVIDQLNRISRAEVYAEGIKVNFSDEYCTDIAPLVALSLIKRDMNKIFRGGMIMPRMSKVVRAIGLDKHMAINIHGDGDNAHVWPFALRERTGNQLVETEQLVSQQQNEAAESFITELQGWLEEVTSTDETDAYQLTLNDEKNTVKIITEILDNAERHSGKSSTFLGKWLFSGFMAKRGRNTPIPYYQCNIAIISPGRTISEAISATADQATLDVINEYVERHKGVRCPEALRTVVAAQPGMTTLRYGEARGGMGIPKVVELMNRLGGRGDPKNLPEMVIVSGSSCLKFRYPYNSVDQNRLHQWFNAENDSLSPPSEQHVVRLHKPFPGTVITMTFRMSPER